MYILGIIPARGGSKSIPLKNIKLVNGKPLIEYTIEQALNSKIFDHIVVSTDSETIRYIFPKGYIALNGVSLTVGDVDKSNKTFNVYLIPETLRLTNLGSKTVGDKINLEIETQTRNMVDTISEINKESIHG